MRSRDWPLGHVRAHGHATAVRFVRRPLCTSWQELLQREQGADQAAPESIEHGVRQLVVLIKRWRSNSGFGARRRRNSYFRLRRG